MSSVTGSAPPLRASATVALLVMIASGCTLIVAIASGGTLLVASAACADDAAPQRDLSTLMGHFAASRGVEASFREEKTLPLLQDPLVSEGLLYYAPPGRMARFTLLPEQASLLVLPDRLRMEDGLGVEEVDFGAHPEARRFIDQLMLLFQGDRRALERDYEVDFDAEGDVWTLVLSPRGMALRQVIRQIVLRGREAQLDEMVIAGRYGEVTRTTYGRMQTDRPFEDDELAQLFPPAGSPSALESPGAPAQ